LSIYCVHFVFKYNFVAFLLERIYNMSCIILTLAIVGLSGGKKYIVNGNLGGSVQNQQVLKQFWLMNSIQYKIM
jgi:hypothetical protein